jgi:hypothetical protein
MQARNVRVKGCMRYQHSNLELLIESLKSHQSLVIGRLISSSVGRVGLLNE